MPHMDTGISQLIHYPSHSVVKQCFVDVDDTVAQKIVVHRDSPRGTSSKGLNSLSLSVPNFLLLHFIGYCLSGGGYSVFYPRNTIPSTPKAVNDIHKRGGTILGTSRGGHDKSQIVDSIQDLQVCIIGGDGTRKGFSVIFDVFLLRMQARGSFAINFEAFNTLSAELF
ncbi:hypothetical protein D5086_001736 [Populus alba]|uniref:Uncharacterized protein n=1 Tax=Populus alba TaxID=43335 RepID=A0ACC4D1T0_POPAL